MGAAEGFPDVGDYRRGVRPGRGLGGIAHRNDSAASLYGDEIWYNSAALELLGDGHFEGTYRAPLYPALVALVYRVAGPSVFAVYAAQAVIFAAALVFICLIAWRVTQDRRKPRSPSSSARRVRCLRSLASASC